MGVLGGVLAFMSAWLWIGDRGGQALQRLSTQPEADGRSRRPVRPPLVEDPPRRTAVCVVAAGVVGWLFGGLILAAVTGAAGVLLSWWVGRLEPPSAARRRADISDHLPLAVDLLAACAAVGRPVETSLRVVADSVGGAVSAELRAVASRIELGADPVAEWSRLGQDPSFRPLARTMCRTIQSGAPLVDGLALLAEDRRRERRMQSQVRARSVGVKAAGPLAACFLPAFMLVGIVPTVVGAFQSLFW